MQPPRICRSETLATPEQLVIGEVPVSGLCVLSFSPFSRAPVAREIAVRVNHTVRSDTWKVRPESHKHRLLFHALTTFTRSDSAFVRGLQHTQGVLDLRLTIGVYPTHVSIRAGTKPPLRIVGLGVMERIDCKHPSVNPALHVVPDESEASASGGVQNVPIGPRIPGRTRRPWVHASNESMWPNPLFTHHSRHLLHHPAWVRHSRKGLD